ncbi:MAG: hypothetical protein KC657_32480 [Myxococcales bacterium]|nr:hypothetical protein [Myxococcales bacterium]
MKVHEATARLAAITATLAAMCASACRSKEVAQGAPAPTNASPTPSSGDGRSKDSPLSLAMGNPVEGVLSCDGPPWFVVVPAMEAQIRYELQVPPGAEQHCTHLNARDGTGQVLDSTVALCSDNPATFASGQAPFGRDTRFFTIDKNVPNGPCVKAKFRLTLLER